MPIITLLTDFGLKDGYVGVMKGVIWSISPAAQIADLSHAISPQNVLQGALVLERTAGYFPAGTIHIAVVDPGVGTARRPIAVRLGEHTFVGPDNGLFSLVIAKAQAAHLPVSMVHLDRPEFWLAQVSRVFHGRDIFAPTGAHLANGVPLGSLGTPITDPVRLALPRPQPTADGWVGNVIDIDAFGNLQTNLLAEHLQGLEQVTVQVNHAVIKGLSQTFGDRPAGELAALIDSSGYLSIAVVNGSAANDLPAAVGNTVKVHGRPA
jgi:S-adenosyl-L-methionine hydrolase (adenosine-forming)